MTLRAHQSIVETVTTATALTLTKGVHILVNAATTIADATIVGQIHTIICKTATTTTDVDFTTTLGAYVKATFAASESIQVQWTGTDGWAVIGHGTGATGDTGTGPVLA